MNESIKIELEKYLSSEEINILLEAHRRVEKENLLFDKIETPKWFYPLKLLGYFQSENIPELKQQDGSISIPIWNILTYLEKLSNLDDLSEDIIDEILLIIKNTTIYHINNVSFLKGDKIKTSENFRIWYRFIRILCNLPNKKVTNEILGFIDVWIKSSFNNMTLSREITSNLIPKFLNEKSDNEDIEKFELIFESFTSFHSEELETEFSELFGKNRYHFNADFYSLNELCNDKNFIRLVGEKVSSKFFDNLKSKILHILFKTKNSSVFEDGKNSIRLNIYNRNDKFEVDAERIFDILPSKLFYPFTKNKDDTLKIEKIFNAEILKTDFTNIIEEFKEIIKKLNIFPEKEDLLKDAKQLYSGVFNFGTYESFYSINESSINDSFELLGKILREVLVVKSNQIDSNNIELTKRTIENYLLDEYLYFKKIALYSLAESKNNYNEIFFDSIAKKEVNYVILEEFYFGDELDHYFHIFTKLDEKNIDLLHRLIEMGSQIFTFKEDAVNNEKIWKQKLYKALSNIDFFKLCYEKLKEETHVDYSMHAAIGVSETYWHEPVSYSPISKDNFKLMKNTDIAESITHFKDKYKDTIYSAGGLINELGKLISEYPEKFTDNYSPFLKSDFIVIWQILESLKKAWENKKKLNWINIFEFFYEYFKIINWDKELIIEDFTHLVSGRTIIDSMTSLIKSGSKDINYSMDENELKKSLVILNLFLGFSDLIKDDYMKNNMEDYYTVSMNTLLGDIIEANILILRSLTFKNRKSEQKIRWTKDEKEKFNLLLEKNYLDAYAQLGGYLRVFDYLDADWSLQKINLIDSFFINKEKNILWKAFMDGYFYNGIPSLKIYKSMNGNYQKLLDCNDCSDHSKKGLMSHICLGYLEGDENLEPITLFGALIINKNYQTLEDIITIFSQYKNGIILDEYDNSITEIWSLKLKRDRINKFTNWIFDEFKFDKYNLTEEQKKLLANVSKLVCYFYEIDEEKFEWLKLVAPQSGKYFNSPYLIEYLDKLKDKGDKLTTAKYISEIYLEMFNEFVPDYDKKHIISILKFLQTINDIEIDNKLERIKERYSEYGRKDVIEE